MRVYNTLNRKVELIRSIHEKKIGFYACGPTVYFYAHIGNMRTYITQDILRRALIHEGYSVRHVMNITDVGHNVGDGDVGEDKVRMEAKAEHKGMDDIINFYTDKFFKEESILNIQRPEVVCKASEHINDMLELIERLDAGSYLYKASNGVYFDTSLSKKYGELAGTTFERMNKELKAGARVERPQGIRNITDFAVWRFAEHNEKDMVWDTRFGRGFPGWHIECSAMSMKYLGEQIDIHAGGVDHIPIHHTNELAQSEAATGKRFVRYWVHGEFMTVDGHKMSKSLRNIYTVDDIIKRGYLPMAYRYLCLTVHYRNMLNFTFEALEHSQKSLKSIYAIISRISALNDTGTVDKNLAEEIKTVRDSFFSCIEDDIDTPSALSKLHALASLAGRKNLSGAECSRILDVFLEFDEVLGLRFNMHLSSALPKEAKELIEKREDARRNKDFNTSDEIRTRLRKEFKISVEDTDQGTIWFSSID